MAATIAIVKKQAKQVQEIKDKLDKMSDGAGPGGGGSGSHPDPRIDEINQTLKALCVAVDKLATAMGIDLSK